MAAGLAVVLVITSAAVLVASRSNGSAGPKAWDPRVADIAQFVQSVRGLTWKHPVKVEFLTPSRFEALMAKENAPTSDHARQSQDLTAMMRAMGVTSGNFDAVKSAQQFAQSDIVGQYVERNRTVYVRGDTMTPYVRSTLAHELTHALQAQYFDLARMRNGHADDDSAVTALIEGDAVRVQNSYERAMSAADQNLLMREQQQTSGQIGNTNSEEQIPQFMIDQASFPYDFGPTFVAYLLSSGGNAAVDDAFRNPPNLDAQIVDPSTFTLGVEPPVVSLPPVPTGATQIVSSSGFGEVTLVEMLGDQIGFTQASAAMASWEQDRYQSYRQDGQVCIDISVLTAGPAAAASLNQIGEQWAHHLPNATVSQTATTVNFHSCDPGPTWKPAPDIADPYQALAVRSQVTYQLLIATNLQPTVATCAANRLMNDMGPQKLQEAEGSTDPNSAAVEELRHDVKTSVTACQTAQDSNVPSPDNPGGSAAGDSPNFSTPTPIPPTPQPPASADAHATTTVTASCVPSVPYESTEQASLSHPYAFLLPTAPAACLSLAGLRYSSVPQCTCTYDHVHVDIYPMGGQVVIPAGIGVNAANRETTGLFTLSNTGIVAFSTNHTYTLGQLFLEWGHPLTSTQIGSIRPDPNHPLTWYVNGVAVANPASIILHNHDEIWAFQDLAGAPVGPTSTFAWPPGY